MTSVNVTSTVLAALETAVAESPATEHQLQQRLVALTQDRTRLEADALHLLLALVIAMAAEIEGLLESLRALQSLPLTRAALPGYRQ